MNPDQTASLARALKALQRCGLRVVRMKPAEGELVELWLAWRGQTRPPRQSKPTARKEAN